MTENTPKKVVTRFAPSPTGHLHIGGARTALFNWAFAKKHNGTFIIRMEDTDKARSTTESTTGILKDLQWLGIDWDCGPNPDAADPMASQLNKDDTFRGPFFQSQRSDKYQDAIAKLISDNRAYKCFKTTEELGVLRKAAREAKLPYKYDGTEMKNLTEDEIKALEDKGIPSVIRFKMAEQDITVKDLVLGDITFKREELEDFIIVKSDGGPTFHLANVVDDALMGVTHALRAQEHLMNTPKHIALAIALGHEPPHYAHMPLIFNSDGSKMSKRDKAKLARKTTKEWIQANKSDVAGILNLFETAGREPLDGVEDPYSMLEGFLKKKNDSIEITAALASILDIVLPEIDVHDFRATGYLPETLNNYLSLLGWSPGNNVEHFDNEFLKANFNIEKIGKSNAKFDRVKLMAFNTDKILELSPDEFYGRFYNYLEQFYPEYISILGQSEGDLRLLADSYRERSRTLREPADNGKFFIADDKDIAYDAKAVKKFMRKAENKGLNALTEITPILEAIEDWTPEAINETIKTYCEEKEVGMGTVAQPIRIAISGATVTPPIDMTLSMLGQPKTIRRIKKCCEALSQEATA